MEFQWFFIVHHLHLSVTTRNYSIRSTMKEPKSSSKHADKLASRWDGFFCCWREHIMKIFLKRTCNANLLNLYLEGGYADYVFIQIMLTIISLFTTLWATWSFWGHLPDQKPNSGLFHIIFFSPNIITRFNLYNFLQFCSYTPALAGALPPACCLLDRVATAC